MQAYIRNRTPRGYDLNLIAVIGISTLVLVLQRYYPVDINFPSATQLTYYLLIPLAAGGLLFRDKPSDYGIRIGHWKLGVTAIAVGLAIMSLVLYGASKLPEFHSYYHRYLVDWPGLLLRNALYMFAWEFLFRGYMLFSLERSIGKNAIFVQTIPFTLLHFGRPFLETLCCIPGGFIFGYVAYRTRSFLPCFIIHFGMYTMMTLFTNS